MINQVIEQGNKVNLILSQIKTRRENLGLSQAEMAEEIGFKTQAAYNLIENGERKLTLEVFLLVAKILGESPCWFLEMDSIELSSDELEIVEIYRALPDIAAKKNALLFLRGYLREKREG